MIEIKTLSPDQWQLYKTIRCRALAEAPYAYSSTLDDALKRSDEEWQQLTLQYARDPNSTTYFTFEGEVPCGMSACVVDGSEAEMFAVWVDPDYRRKGIGSLLIEFARAWSELQGARKLKVGVFDDNLAALVFYRLAGFKDLGLIKPELSSEDQTVVLLTMNLS